MNVDHVSPSPPPLARCSGLWLLMNPPFSAYLFHLGLITLLVTPHILALSTTDPLNRCSLGHHTALCGVATDGSIFDPFNLVLHPGPRLVVHLAGVACLLVLVDRKSVV